MTSAVECSEINGKTECTRRKTVCDNGWGIGCEDQAFGSTSMNNIKDKDSDNRLVPFSQPQANMGMRNRPIRRSTTTTRRPRRTTRTTTALGTQLLWLNM